MADINIYGVLKNATPENVITVASQIKDETMNKTQEVINKQFLNGENLKTINNTNLAGEGNIKLVGVGIQDFTENEEQQIKSNLNINDKGLALEYKKVNSSGSATSSSSSSILLDTILPANVKFLILDLAYSETSTAPSSPNLSIIMSPNSNFTKWEGGIAVDKSIFKAQATSDTILDSNDVSVDVTSTANTCNYTLLGIRYSTSSGAGFFKGHFNTKGELIVAYPIPDKGAYAYVGNPRHLYTYNTSWVDNGVLLSEVKNQLGTRQDIGISQDLATKLTTEYNVSLMHPKEGPNGDNKYTLETAIQKIPKELRTVGIKCSFITDNGYELWKYIDGDILDTSNWAFIGLDRLDKIEDKIYDKIIYKAITIDILLGANGESAGFIEGYYTTEYIPCPFNKQIIYNGVLSKYVAGVVAYDSHENKTVLLKGTSETAVDIYRNKVIELPKNCVKIRCCSYGKPLVKGVWPSEYNFSYKKIKDEVCLNTANGLEFAKVGCSVTDYIFVADVDYMIINNKQGEQTGIAGYDSFGNHICRLSDNSNLSTFKSSDNRDMVIPIPSDVVYIKASTLDSINHPISIHLNRIHKKEIVIVKDLKNLSVSVWSETQQEYLTHTFKYIEKTHDVSYGISQTKRMITQSGWYGLDIRNSNFQLLLDGNYNFIYKIDSTLPEFYDEGNHVGITHGCEITDWTEFMVDGKLLNLEQTNNKVFCNTFTFIQSSKCFVVSKSNSSNNDNGVPKLLEDGTPVINAVHYMSAALKTNNNICCINKLIILRDNIVFSQLHAGMIAAYYPFFTRIELNDTSNTRNNIIFEQNKISTEVIPPSDVLVMNRGFFRASSILCTDDKYTLRQNIINTTFDNSHRNISYSPYPLQSRYKFYFMPIYCNEGNNLAVLSREIGKNITADKLHKGDIIECIIERNIE